MPWIKYHISRSSGMRKGWAYTESDTQKHLDWWTEERAYEEANSRGCHVTAEYAEPPIEIVQQEFKNLSAEISDKMRILATHVEWLTKHAKPKQEK